MNQRKQEKVSHLYSNLKNIENFLEIKWLEEKFSLKTCILIDIITIWTSGGTKCLVQKVNLISINEKLCLIRKTATSSGENYNIESLASDWKYQNPSLFQSQHSQQMYGLTTTYSPVILSVPGSYAARQWALEKRERERERLPVLLHEAEPGLNLAKPGN